MPGFNKDNNQYGKTRFVDLASYVYLRRITLDLFAQSYKGYYDSENILFRRKAAEVANPIIPDMRSVNLGVNAQYIVNSKRFSYRAAFLQNEWQIRSAGSPLFGANINYYRATKVRVAGNDPKFEDYFALINKAASFTIGANIGYAYTYVYKKHLFATVALSGGPGIAMNHTEGSYGLLSGDKVRFWGPSFQLNTTVRLALGYNSARHFAGIYFVDYASRTRQYSVNNYEVVQQNSSGMIRFVVAYRFLPRQRVTREVRKRLDEAEERILGK